MAATYVYGYCPICKCHGKSRERRPHGNDTCINEHVYPSSRALKYPEDHIDVLLKKLDEAGRQGLDLSPGDNLCREAAKVIRELRGA